MKIETPPTGGTFTITIGRKTTPPLPYDASDEVVYEEIRKITTRPWWSPLVWFEWLRSVFVRRHFDTFD